MKDQADLKAPAKINLTLKVVGKRVDGYHELETVMQQIDLCDLVSIIRTGTKGITVRSNSGDVPDDSSNLAFKAAQLFLDKLNLQIGLRIEIDKRIPVGAGLAGGSTDAAAVLVGLNDMIESPVDMPTLMALGLQVGSDVPFCLMGGPAVARGRGEILEAMPTGPALEMVLVKPPSQLSTAQVYADLRLEELHDPPDNGAFLEAWRKCDIMGLAAQMKNDLETVSIAKCPEISKVKQRLVELGAIHAIMSGSGPSVIGLFVEHQLARSCWHRIKTEYDECFLVSNHKT
ncbi:MAG: 4-(cytidine 5'-diphospho)-2-C-methyl-D-erythritol kinase [Syntrophomonas sp.]|nr:4-(cytidine 5'-diphospho)-2-C-methyl-D-erythritol kinase [Syntrophomonas sp.]